jgi:transposase-like protein
MERVLLKFSDEFEQEAVRLGTVRGVSLAQAARDLEVHVNLLRLWIRAATGDAAVAESGGQSAKVDQAELTRPPKEVAKLKMERDIQKGLGLLCQGVDVKIGVAVTHRGTWQALMLCDMLGVSRSGFYAWLDRAESARGQPDAALVVAIRASFVLSDRTYGARRIQRDRSAEGLAVGQHRVQHESLRRRLRQRGDFKFLLDAENGTHRAEAQCDTGRGARRRVRLLGTLLQSDPEALHVGLCQTSGI